MKILDKSKFEKISSNWRILNKNYDLEIESFLNNPNKKIDQKQLNKILKMQKELFDLETYILEILKK